jgi:class 3 adenylate cyclase/TolB-like protein
MTSPPPPPPIAPLPGAGEAIPTLLLPQREEVVLVMDLVESVRLMAADEESVIASWRGFVGFAKDTVLPRHGGRLVKSLGDGIMAEFESAREGVAAASTLQHYFDRANAGVPPERRMYLRGGLNATRVYVDDIDIYGSGINLAARVATLAGPGETMVTEEVRDGLVECLDAEVEDMGECHLKHVPEPVRVYRVGPAAPSSVLVPVREYQKQLQPTLAVIPFRLIAGPPEARVIGDVIADAVIGQLARTPQLSVISRLSVAALRDRDTSAQSLSHLLGADHVISGSYHVHGDRLVCTAELADARSNTIVWTDRAESDVEGLFRLEAELPHWIACRALAALMDEQAKKATVAPLPTLRSYAILLGGIQLMHQSSPLSFDRSREALDHLVERHPRSSIARAWRAKWSVLKATRGLVDDAAAEANLALDHTRRALDAEPDNALALAIEGFVYCHLKSDLHTAQERIEAALAVDPSCSLAWLFRATVQSFQEDQGAAAVQSAEKAMALSPLDPLKYYYHSLLAAALLFNNDLERALQEARRSWTLNKYHAPTLRVLVIAAAESGDLEFARLMVQRLREVEPELTVERYLSRRPVVTDRVRRFAEALASAGLPLH